MNASVHWHTPSLAVIGPRGEAVRQVDYLRRVAGEDVQALIARQQYDVAGRLVALRDPRLPTPNSTMVHRLDGMAVKTHNVDAGNDTVLPGPGGQLLHHWDANDNHREMTYDPLLRLLAVTENGAANFETFRYLDASADPTLNLRGQMTALSDPSGTLALNSFGMHGQTLEETRTFKDGKTFTSRHVLSAVGALLQTTDAGGHLQQSTYDIAGQLVQVQLQLNGQTFQPVLKGTDYNAAGQIIEQQLGNDVTNHWHYREADGRLLRQYAQKASEPAIQNFGYEYDLVGNVTRIVDHTYTPTFFRNQRVDGQRTFGYDSTYELIRATGYSDAPPRDNPGRPQPTDPRDRRNHVETFEYDKGKNLTRLTHVRDGSSHTAEMFIDPDNNRGVRWKTGDPAPVFPEWFDRAGNQLALQRGQPMQWNSRNQLESLTLVEHASGPPDQELYQYSQKVRVYKRLETHTRKVSHVEQVHYVGNLQIRSKSSGEELHRITVAIGVGEVTCLHWVAGKPPGIDDDQMRYCLTDLLGSSVTELDQLARLISQEGYFAYGATAWMVAEKRVEADYKFIRYSGKEMDVTGLYYYGARYYAPWLCRWISSDPAGDNDGLNRYAFVGNNPITYFDNGGTQRKPSEQRQMINDQVAYLSTAQQSLDEVNQQFGDLTSPAKFRLKVLKNFIYLAGRATVGFFSGWAVTGHAFKESTTPGELQGLSLGNFTADSAVGAYEKIMAPLKMNAPILPRHANLEPGSIRDQSSGTSPGPLDGFTVNPETWEERSENIRTLFSIVRDSGGGAILPGVSEIFELMRVAKDATKAEQQLTAIELDAYDSLLDNLEKSIVQAADIAEAIFNEMGVGQFYANGLDYLIDIGLGKVGATDSRAVSRSDIKKYREKALNSLHETRTTVKRYRQYASINLSHRAPSNKVVHWWNNGGR